MRLIRPKTKEYSDCLRSMVRTGRWDELRAVRRLPDASIQIVNEGDDPEVKDHPLNFARYNSRGGFMLFGLNF